jgi:hypothetical protein
LGFLGWLFARPPALHPAPWALGTVLMYALCVTTWATAFIGTGVMAGIPVSALLLTQMGVLARLRDGQARPPAARETP